MWDLRLGDGRWVFFQVHGLGTIHSLAYSTATRVYNPSPAVTPPSLHLPPTPINHRRLDTQLAMIRFDQLPPDVMQAMCTPMHLILPPSGRAGALYLGSLSAVFDSALLASHSIGALVQVLDAPWLPSVETHGPKMESYRLDILDSTTADLKPHLEATVRWIDDRLRKGVNVLVHCQQVCGLSFL